jgi:uncharacterized protein (TIRG00374 family)
MNRRIAEALEQLRAGRLEPAFRLAAIAAAAGLAAHLVFLRATSASAGIRIPGITAPVWLLVAAALAMLPWLTNAVRVAIWLRLLGRPIRFGDALRLTFATELGSAVTPTAAGGGAVKTGLLVRHGLRPGEAASLTAWGSLEDGLVFLVALPAAIRVSSAWTMPAVQAAWDAVVHRLPGTIVAVALVVAGLALTARLSPRWSATGTPRVARPLAALGGRIGRWWGEARATFALFGRRGTTRLALTLPLTALQWGARYSAVTALAMAFGVRLDPWLAPVLQWAVFTLATVTPTPGGAGGAEGAFLLVYAGLVPGPVLPVLATLWRFVTFYGLVLADALLLSVIGFGRPAVAATGSRGANAAPGLATPAAFGDGVGESVFR